MSRSTLWLIFNNQYTAAQRGNRGQELLLIFVLTAGITEGELHRLGEKKKRMKISQQLIQDVARQQKIYWELVLKLHLFK